jgi:hypothetical protein
MARTATPWLALLARSASAVARRTRPRQADVAGVIGASIAQQPAVLQTALTRSGIAPPIMTLTSIQPATTRRKRSAEGRQGAGFRVTGEEPERKRQSI